VTTAPDLVRFALISPTRGAASGQVLFSRSQGVAVTARLRALENGQTYQLWLAGTGGATSAGLFSPGADGRVAAVFDTPAGLPRPVLGARVTIEPAGGSAVPSGPAYLATAAAPAAAPAPPPVQ
jgi:anti-sigma-K factor RskA